MPFYETNVNEVIQNLLECYRVTKKHCQMLIKCFDGSAGFYDKVTCRQILKYEYCIPTEERRFFIPRSKNEAKEIVSAIKEYIENVDMQADGAIW